MITLILLAAVAVVVSELAGRLKVRATIGSRQARENAAIAAFGQRLAALSSQAETGRAVVDELAGLLGVNALLVTRDGAGLSICAASPADVRLDALDEASVEWTLDRGTPAGAFTDTLAASEWQFHPLKTSLGVLAAIGVSNPDGGHPIPSDRSLLFTTLVGQSALAWERIRLEADARIVGELRSRDELRSTLLASIGHDLRTPLTAVVGAVDALRSEGVQSPRLELLRRETRRLSRFFSDLIDMTRVEANAVAPRIEPVDLTDAATAALSDMESDLAGHHVVRDVPADLPLVRTDARLLNHMLINLLSNAASYAPAGTAIRLSAALEGGDIVLAVEDEGPGLPAGLAERLFDRFQRGDVSDRSGGTGLGLAIVKGFGDALGIAPAAGNRPGGGARFTLRVPQRLLVQAAELAPAGDGAR